MERDFKGVWIPKEIWLNKDLTLQEKAFLVEIDSLDNELGCFASNDYFSKFFCLSKNRCSEIIKRLERKNYLTIVYIHSEDKNNIEKRIIRLLAKSDTPIRKLDRPTREVEEGYSGKCEDNNTVFNNTINNNICVVWDYYSEKLKAIGKSRKKTEGKTKHIKARLNDGFTTDELKAVIDRVFANDFMMGKNDRNKQYIEIENFFCNTEKVEKWLDSMQQKEVKTVKSAAYKPFEFDD